MEIARNPRDPQPCPKLKGRKKEREERKEMKKEKGALIGRRSRQGFVATAPG
ncbi:hypothetical protein CD178_03379 (plasmid) [Komagataeibacter saccharivorans]|uniref:Uncharacterized protein n=1 Tax=Komagataeibacter saccharivorans TaxID=265959 RepID=A0A347WGY0_9PROT|nr:hypothetical protein CD178_03379 [Komagataeibacter saccharivorans]